MNAQQVSEKKLVELIAKGDNAAAAEWFERDYQFVVDIIRQKAPPQMSIEDCEDCATETFTGALTNIKAKQYAYMGKSLRAYLRTISKYKVADHLRYLGKYQTVSLLTDEEGNELAPEVSKKTSVNDETERIHKELDMVPIVNLMHQMLSALPVQDRNIITLKYWKDMNSSQIAKELGLKSDNVRQKLSRIQKRLSKELSPAIKFE